MHHRLSLVLGTALLLAVACKKEASTETPADDAAAGAAEPSAPSLDDLERELAGLEAELGQAGVTPEAGVPASELTGDRCTRVCDLAQAICGLEERICGLAAEHEDEPRYADACARATADCERATEACDGCSH